MQFGVEENSETTGFKDWFIIKEKSHAIHELRPSAVQP